MTKRIREIREQAWKLVSDEERVRGELYEAREQWERCDQKFAELIVKECSSICRNVGDAVWAEQHQSNIGTARTCEAAIRSHFGVDK